MGGSMYASRYYRLTCSVSVYSSRALLRKYILPVSGFVGLVRKRGALYHDGNETL